MTTKTTAPTPDAAIRSNVVFRTMTEAELADEARRRFGDDVKAWAFTCPSCGDVATVQDFLDAGRPMAAGLECIGRMLGALTKPEPTNTRGCGHWIAYDDRGPWEILMSAREGVSPAMSVWSFPLAPAPVNTGGAS